MGTKWEKVIAESISKCDAVLMFLSKGIFLKDESYVHKEFEMATKYFKKKIIIILLDEIPTEIVPPQYVSWWIDVTHMQCIEAYKFSSIPECIDKIVETLGYPTSKENIIKRMKDNFESLNEKEKLMIIDTYIEKITHIQELAFRAKCIAEFNEYGIIGVEKNQINTYTSKPNGQKEFKIQTFCSDKVSFIIGNDTITAEQYTCFHRGSHGDADIINIYKNSEKIYVIGGLIDAYAIKLEYDDIYDILFVLYTSTPGSEEKKEFENKTYTAQEYISVLTIENPTGTAKCNRFDNLVCCSKAAKKNRYDELLKKRIIQ